MDDEEHLYCGGCRQRIDGSKRVDALKKVSFLGCGVHYECGSHDIGIKCVFCICDTCDLPVDSRRMSTHICGCLYHSACDPGPNSNRDGCLWCEEGVRDPSVFKVINDRYRIRSKPAVLTAAKLLRKQPEWGPEAMLGKIFYTADVWAKSGTRADFLQSRGFTVGFFRHLGMQEELFLRAFRSNNPKERFDLGEILAEYPNLDLKIYCRSLDQPWYVGTKAPDAGYPAALVADGVNPAHLFELFSRTQGGVLLEHMAPLEEWQARFSHPLLYALNFQRNIILHSDPLSIPLEVKAKEEASATTTTTTTPPAANQPQRARVLVPVPPPTRAPLPMHTMAHTAQPTLSAQPLKPMGNSKLINPWRYIPEDKPKSRPIADAL